MIQLGETEKNPKHKTKDQCAYDHKADCLFGDVPEIHNVISNIVRVGGYLSMDGRVCKSRFDDGS